MTKPLPEGVTRKKSLKYRLEKFHLKDKESGCWNWVGVIRKDGYGSIIYNGKRWRAHRASYKEFIGDIPVGILVCHKCDNPGCINPEHLFLGTDADNRHDGMRKGRITFDHLRLYNPKRGRQKGTKNKSVSTHCRRGHEYVNGNLIMNKGRRICRICKAIHRKDSRIRMRERMGLIVYEKRGRPKKSLYGVDI